MELTGSSVISTRCTLIIQAKVKLEIGMASVVKCRAHLEKVPKQDRDCESYSCRPVGSII